MVLPGTWWILCGRIRLRHDGNLLNLFYYFIDRKNSLMTHKFGCSLQCLFISLVLIKWLIKQHFTAAWLFSILVADDSIPGVVAGSEQGFPMFWQLCATKLLHVLMNCAPPCTFAYKNGAYQKGIYGKVHFFRPFLYCLLPRISIFTWGKY